MVRYCCYIPIIPAAVLCTYCYYDVPCYLWYIGPLAIRIHEAAVAGDKEALSRLLPDATAEDFKYEAEVYRIAIITSYYYCVLEYF